MVLQHGHRRAQTWEPAQTLANLPASHAFLLAVFILESIKKETLGAFFFHPERVLEVS